MVRGKYSISAPNFQCFCFFVRYACNKYFQIPLSSKTIHLFSSQNFIESRNEISTRSAYVPFLELRQNVKYFCRNTLFPCRTQNIFFYAKQSHRKPGLKLRKFLYYENQINEIKLRWYYSELPDQNQLSKIRFPKLVLTEC